jgi:hypothetical protein
MDLINKIEINSEVKIMTYSGMYYFNNNDNLVQVLNTETRVYAALEIFVIL